MGPAPPISTAPEAADAYRLGERLHAGSAGDVYEAAHPWLPGRYAIKILHPSLTQMPEAVDEFRDELATIAGLRHPNIAQTIEVGNVPDGRVFVVMELLEGRTLAARLADGRPLPFAEALPIIKAVAGALQGAHAHGVLHLELTPGNVFLARAEGHEQGFVKLLNFGVARLRGGAGGGDVSIAPETASTMAPEQAQGRADDINARTDQFSLAALSYRILAGLDPFRGNDVISALYQTVHEAPPPMPGSVDSGVEAVIRRGLAKDPADRFDSVLAFARALEAVATEPPLDEESATRTPVVANAGGLDSRAATWPGTGPVPQSSSDSADTLPVRARPSVPERVDTARMPHVPALAGGGVFSEAAAAPVPLRSAALMDDASDGDLDGGDDLDVPRQRGRAVILVTALVTIAVGVALISGWRPPAAWRRSDLWRALHLPGGLSPESSAGSPAEPQPPAPSPAPVVVPGGEAAVLDALAAPGAGAADSGTAAVAPAGGPEDKGPSAVGKEAVAPNRAATKEDQPVKEGAAAKPAQGSAAVKEAAKETSDGAPARERPVANKREVAAPKDDQPPKENARPRRRGPEPNRDVVWSDKLQKVVPASDEPPPNDVTPPPVTATPPAP
jgi:serine/threonine-protein kinase